MHTLYTALQMSFLGIQQPTEAKVAVNVALGPEAFIVGKTGSPGVKLDLGRTESILPAVRKGHGPRSCDVLLVMTRKRAVLLYFAVGEDVRYCHATFMSRSIRW